MTAKENKLILLEPTEKRTTTGGIIWKCLCKCGKISYHEGSRVKKNIITSCGCGRRSKNSKESILKAKYRDYRWGAKKRSLKFQLSYKRFKEIVKDKCYYCGSAPSMTGRGNKIKGDFKILINGIDRKNNDVGYTKENCVPCCKICNRAKDVMTTQEFEGWIKKANNHIVLKQSQTTSCLLL